MNFFQAVLEALLKLFGLRPSNDAEKTIERPVIKDNRSLAERNNNPGNLRPSNAPYKGQVGVDSNNYLIFESPEMGLRAMMVTLRTYFTVHRLTTVRKIIYRWAPPSDNNPTESYINFVCLRLNKTADQELNFDMVVVDLCKAMVDFETGKKAPYSDSQYRLARSMI